MCVGVGSSHELLRSDSREYLSITQTHLPPCTSLPFLEDTWSKVSLLQEKHFVQSGPSPEVHLLLMLILESLKGQLCAKIP